MEDFHLSWHSICHYSLCAYIQHEENSYEIIHCNNQGSDDNLLGLKIFFLLYGLMSDRISKKRKTFGGYSVQI